MDSWMNERCVKNDQRGKGLHSQTHSCPTGPLRIPTLNSGLPFYFICLGVFWGVEGLWVCKHNRLITLTICYSPRDEVVGNREKLKAILFQKRLFDHLTLFSSDHPTAPAVSFLPVVISAANKWQQQTPFFRLFMYILSNPYCKPTWLASLFHFANEKSRGSDLLSGATLAGQWQSWPPGCLLQSQRASTATMASWVGKRWNPEAKVVVKSSRVMTLCILVQFIPQDHENRRGQDTGIA